VNEVIAHKLALSYSSIGSIAEVWPIVDPYHSLCSSQWLYYGRMSRVQRVGCSVPWTLSKRMRSKMLDDLRHIDREHDSPPQVILI
jgi:hypothetical protein